MTDLGRFDRSDGTERTKRHRALLTSIYGAYEREDPAGRAWAYEELMHCKRVGKRGNSEREQIVGFWHDAVESDVIPALPDEDFTDAERLDIAALTRPIEENYVSYINRLVESGSMVALIVKTNDLLDHLDPARAHSLRPTLLTRYLDALGKLARELHTRQTRLPGSTAERGED